MTTHPAEVNESLGLAHARCQKLIGDAERRGDQPGADAWLVALRSIEAAEKAMREAREKQTWTRKSGVVPGSVVPGLLGVGCPTCGSSIGDPCVFSMAERHGLNETVHRSRSNRLLVACDRGTRGCRGHGEKHACVAGESDIGRTKLQLLARKVLVNTKHGPNQNGSSGPCDDDCVKCMAGEVLDLLGVQR